MMGGDRWGREEHLTVRGYTLHSDFTQISYNATIHFGMFYHSFIRCPHLSQKPNIIHYEVHSGARCLHQTWKGACKLVVINFICQSQYSALFFSLIMYDVFYILWSLNLYWIQWNITKSINQINVAWIRMFPIFPVAEDNIHIRET
jgi:hypothetical protein